MTCSRRSSHRRSGVNHGHRCRLLLGDQRARAGEAWSCTSPHTDVTQVVSQCRPYKLLLRMLTLLTACTWGTGSVTCSRVGAQHQQRSEATEAWADCQ